MVAAALLRVGSIVGLIAGFIVGLVAPSAAATAYVPPEQPDDTLAGAAQAADPVAGARFVPVQPCRLLDTRGPDQNAPATAPAAGATLTFDVAGKCTIPSGAVAAALTVTAVGPAADGYVTLFPAGAQRPGSSTLNYRAGQTVANLQLTRLSGGQASVFTLAASHLVVDVAGYFEVPPNGASEVRRGRFVALQGGRLLDTRATERPQPQAVVTVDTGPAGVPADAVAVVINLTTADATGPDFFTTYPAGSQRPTASVLNVDRAGQARAAAVVVPVSDAKLDVFTRNGNHVIVDLLGYFTGSSANLTSDGLFVPVDPFRLADTRGPSGASGGPRLWDDGGREFPVSTQALGAPEDGVAALAVNATVTATEDAGWIALAAAGVPVPGTSSVNYPAAQQTVANSAIVGLSDRGIQVQALESTHVVVDVTGWFTGAPAQPVQAPPANNAPADRKVTIITDSAIAGVRWNGALASLQGFTVDHRMESCRRLVAPSCRGREGYRPLTVIGEIATLPPAGPEDILVIGTGYDDWWERFSSDFDEVMAAGRGKGFHHIVWLTFRSNVDYGLGESYARMNEVLAAKAASGEYPDVRIWDFAAYTASAPGWFTSDDIHLTRLGSWGTGDWISRQVRAFDDRPCPQPWGPGQPVDDPCPDPDAAVAQRGLPDIGGLYNL